MSNPFNIPPPWNAGYAVPSNVADEGLERRGIVTRWAPRGTFDNPKVGHGGYAVPGYVLDEGYGEGSVMTKWTPRGTYFGPKIPHWVDKAPKRIKKIARLPGGKTKAVLSGLGDTERKSTGSTALTDYANTLAFNLIDTVRMMPDEMRKRELRKAMDGIDPKLYSRAEKFAQDEAQAGAPALVALQRGIARAAVEGLGSELVNMGKGKMPPRQSQLGCAMYGMGAAPTFATDAKKNPPNGTCAIIDGDKKVIWDDSAKSWRPFRQGDKCTGYQGQILVGGFIFSADPSIKGSAARINWTPDRGKLPDELRQAVLTRLTTDCHPCIKTSMRQIQGSRWEPLRKYIPELRDTLNHDPIGGPTDKDFTDYPLFGFKHPMTGEKWGMYMLLTAPKPREKFDENNQAYPVFMIKKLPEESWFDKILDGLWWLVCKYVEVWRDIGNWVGEKTCKLLCSQYGQMAGAAAGAAAGAVAGAAAGGKEGAKTGAQVGAQLGSAGASLAAGACDCGGAAPPPSTPPPTPPSEKSILPWLLLGGAGAAAYYLTKKK